MTKPTMEECINVTRVGEIDLREDVKALIK